MDWIKQWWPLAAFALTTAMAAGSLNSKVDALEKRLGEKISREAKLDEVLTLVARFEERIKHQDERDQDQKDRVERLVEWIKKINERVKLLEQRR